MRTLSLLCSLVLLAVSVTSCGGDLSASADGPRLKKFSLAAAGDTLTAKWTWKGALAGTDMAYVTWSQKAISATTWTVLAPVEQTRATSASRVIPQLATGDTVRVCLVVKRTSAPDSPISCAQKGRAPAASPGVDSLQVALFVTDGNLAYTRNGFFNVATYKGTDVAGCDLTGGAIDALGRQVTGCRLASGGAAYTAVQCVLVERYAKGVLQFVSYAYPSNTVSDCQTKAAPLAAGKYGAKWQPGRVPLDSIAFQQLPTVRGDATQQYRIRALASLR